MLLCRLINPRRTCTARVTVLGLSVYVCVCLSSYFYSRTTGNEAAHELYTRLQRNKCSKNNVADLAKTAAFWQEKPALLWTTFHDPTHQLARWACVFITHLGACLTGSAPGAALPESCVAVNATSSAASLFQYLLLGYVGICHMAPVAVVVLASFSPTQFLPVTYTNVFAPKVCTLLLTLGAHAPEGYCSCPCPSVR